MAVSNKLRSEISRVASEILSTQPTFSNASATIFPNIYGYVVYMPIFTYMWKQRTIYEVCLEIYIVGHMLFPLECPPFCHDTRSHGQAYDPS